MIKRCSWAKTELDIDYHDNEWGMIEYSEQKLFELLILEGMQAGLSWNIILKKRENFRESFNNFDYKICANYTDDFLNSQLNNEGIIRHKLKIYAIRTNAIAFLKIQNEFGSFFNYIWSFVDNKKINNTNYSMSDIPAKNNLSDKISKDMKKRGFKFVGSTIVYSFLQAIGVINDHLIDCICYEKCLNDINTKNS